MTHWDTVLTIMDSDRYEQACEHLGGGRAVEFGKQKRKEEQIILFSRRLLKAAKARLPTPAGVRRPWTKGTHTLTLQTVSGSKTPPEEGGHLNFLTVKGFVQGRGR